MSKGMKIVSIPIEVLPRQFDKLPDKAERSTKDSGALHIRPGQTMIMTGDELAFVLDKYNDLRHRFVVNDVPVKDEAKPVPVAGVPVPANEDANEDGGEGESDEDEDTGDGSALAIGPNIGRVGKGGKKKNRK